MITQRSSGPTPDTFECISRRRSWCLEASPRYRLELISVTWERRSCLLRKKDVQLASRVPSVSCTRA
jgi:hypothetical protein